MPLRERVQSRDPDIVEYFDAADRAGYRVGWGHTQNLTLFHREVPAGGWNSSARHWYLAVRFVRGANEALVEPHHFVLRPRGRDREICTLSGAENLVHFEAAIEILTGVRVRPREAPR